MTRSIVFAAAFVLVAAACGSDDTGDTASTDPPATESVEPTDPPATDAPEPTDPPDPPPTDAAEPTEQPDPPATEPPATTTTTEPPRIVSAVGLVPLPGAQLDFTGQVVASQSLVWSLYSGSGGIIVENIGGPLPPGCHGTSFFDPETFELLQIDGTDLEAYATRGDGGCDGMQQEVADGVVDGDAVEINTDDLILFDFGALPGDPFDVSTQVLDPDGLNGVFRAADPARSLFENRLDDVDITHVVGADVLLEVVDGLPNPITEPPPEPGTCSAFDVCLGDRFGVDVADGAGNPGQVLVSGARSTLFTFLGDGEWQALVRIVGGCGINDHFWVFAAATTSVELDLTVTDTLNGESRSYSSPIAFEPILDTAAFATCP